VHDAHSWNFLGCSGDSPVVDETVGSSLAATAQNGASCSTEGMVFDGVDDYVDIDDWEWGGTTSFEVYVKYDSFNSYSHVFDFSNGENSDNAYLRRHETTFTIHWSIRQGSTNLNLYASNWESPTWTHVVLTVSSTTMKVYKNGALVGTKTNGHEPNVLARTQHWCGRSAWSTSGYFDGTIAYLKIYHNKELTDSEVASLQNTIQCYAGSYGAGLPDCIPCPFGTFAYLRLQYRLILHRVNLDFLYLMPLGCITTSNFHRTLVAMTLGPFILGSLNILLYIVLRASGANYRANEAFDWFLFMTFLILPSVCTKIFR